VKEELNTKMTMTAPISAHAKWLFSQSSRCSAVSRKVAASDEDIDRLYSAQVAITGVICRILGSSGTFRAACGWHGIPILEMPL
jgi:hypothetical protein